MSILHTVNKSPFEHSTLTSCLRLASPGDGILLLEDGVYAGLVNSPFSVHLESSLERFRIYVLEPDLLARGILNLVHPNLQRVDYAGFVDLTTCYSKVQAWF